MARTDLTSWLLPTDRSRLEELLVTSRQQLEYAELTRFACRDQWETLQQQTRQAVHAIQVVLSEYQMLEERQVDETTVVMRKAIVFESSSLANQQYDVQMVFKQVQGGLVCSSWRRSCSGSCSSWRWRSSSGSNSWEELQQQQTY